MSQAQEGDQRPGRLPRARSARAICAPNHYWDKTTNTMDKQATARADGARGQGLRHRLVEVVLPHRSGPLAAAASSSTTRSDLPGSTRSRSKLRHEAVQRAQGLLLSVAHARPSGQSRRTSRRPRSTIPTSTSSSITRPSSTARTSPITRIGNQYDPTTGDFAWHDVLMDIKKRNPQDEQRLSARSVSFFGTAGDQRPGDVPAPAWARTSSTTAPIT